MTKYFSPFPYLSTERLRLRETNRDDFEFLLFMRSDEEVGKYIQREPAKSMEDIEAFYTMISEGQEAGKNINWSICLKDNPEMIGSICLWNFTKDRKTAELGYDLHPSFQGRGIMNEALTSVLAYGFKILNLKNILAYTNVKNVASLKLLSKHKFQLMEGEKDPHNDNNLILRLTNMEHE